jgi:hypothetical protein
MTEQTPSDGEDPRAATPSKPARKPRSRRPATPNGDVPRDDTGALAGDGPSDPATDPAPSGSTPGTGNPASGDPASGDPASGDPAPGDGSEVTVVHIERGGIAEATAGSVEVRMGGIGRLDAEEVFVTMGGVGAARADQLGIRMGSVGAALASEVNVTQGAIGSIVAREATIEQSMVRTLVAREVTMNRPSMVLVLLAARVSGDVRPLVDWRGALAIGAAMGLAGALFGRRRGSR